MSSVSPNSIPNVKPLNFPTENEDAKIEENEQQPPMTAEEMAEFEKLLAEIQKMAEAQGAVNDSSAPQPKSDNEAPPLPPIDLSQINIPLNKEFYQDFDPMTRLMSLFKDMVGPAFQYSTITPAAGLLTWVLSTSTSHAIPALTGLGVAAGSIYLAGRGFSQIADLGKDSSNQNAKQTTASSIAALAQVALGAYGALSGVGVLTELMNSNRAVGVLTLSAALLSARSFSNQKEENTSWFSTAFSAAKTAFTAYGVVGGIGSLTRIGDLPGMPTLIDLVGRMAGYATSGTSLLNGLSSLVGYGGVQILLGTVVMFGMQMYQWDMIRKGFGSVQEALSGMLSDGAYGDEYERLCGIGQDQYHQEISKVMNIPYDKIQGSFEPLRVLNALHPENGAKPLIAKLIVIEKEVNKALDQYNTLKMENKLKELDQFLGSTLKPKLIEQLYLKHCILDPTRPELGKVSPDGKSYYSYISHLLGQNVEMALNEVDLTGIKEEANEIFLKEAYFQKLAYQEMEQQAKAAQEAGPTVNNDEPKPVVEKAEPTVNESELKPAPEKVLGNAAAPIKASINFNNPMYGNPAYMS